MLEAIGMNGLAGRMKEGGRDGHQRLLYDLVPAFYARPGELRPLFAREHRVR